MDCASSNGLPLIMMVFFFFNDTATTEIYTLHIVGSVRCVQETVVILLAFPDISSSRVSASSVTLAMQITLNLRGEYSRKSMNLSRCASGCSDSLPLVSKTMEQRQIGSAKLG
eukprot:TRINITY_DN5530_c0_g1_i2.p2 TRINITY_DN5530_c0_g1~~TRINITY_DN5530_c0_g1_i2.p2  ORF type:complete len:113 (+),score=3.63 TRINITY_DN5530_c0_g1_i2:94-432(+)